MFQKNKYDVMESETKKHTFNILLLVGRIAKDFKAYEKKKDNSFNDKLADVIGKGLPSIKALAHIGYENSVDLANINKEELEVYLRENNLSFENFNRNYKRIINNYVKAILGFMIVESEKIELVKIVTPEILLGLVDGDLSKLKSLLVELNIELSTSNKDLLDKLIMPNFSISYLNDSQKALLDRCHFEYMKKNIYSKVDTNVKDDKKIMKYAKGIGKKKSTLEI